MSVPPDADFVVLTSRLAPDRDGGYAVAVAARLRLLRSIGVARPLLLTFDVAAADDRAEVSRDDAQAEFETRNLFQELRDDSSWLYGQARDGRPDPETAYRVIRDAAGREVVSLPVISGDPGWYLTTAPVVVPGEQGPRTVAGFSELWRAWLTRVVAQLRSRAGDDQRCIVLICESKQLGEVIADWADPHLRIVHTVHNSHLAPPYEPGSAVRDDGWRRWLGLLDRFDAVVWPTASQMSDVAARFGGHEGFVALPTPIPATPTVAAEPDLGRPRRGAREVLMVNRLVAQKRVDAAISAWPRVLENVPDAQLHIYGDGPLRDVLHTLVEERGLTESVHLHGFSDHVRDAMRTSAVFLSTSAFEGQNLAIGEALTSGLPVVAFDVRYGPREYVGTGGVLIPPDDVEGVAAALTELLTDDALRSEVAGRAREEARRLSPERVGSEFARVLGDVVARPARRRDAA
ncbi:MULTISPECIES: glycosyltransferase [Microbacterium]|uniref:glycosyltransferase n=1 Tax=Microbacterium TaxID=33882 RepID=UPI00277D6373|nr:MULTISPECIES: glycosyltransferase [Microbacterium]MDQ1082384.1 poly(glycerol-phosphate) alpha-glucosyltransferase [Microbacterium sp. SORGH_AS_0344]MDQ1168845.1 poly(glycerol-phosphate) alpha-glucosyltransferase [Microbacterium proteolyticum]